MVRTVPDIRTSWGMTFRAELSVSNVQTDTTRQDSGSAFRDAIDCNATMIWAATTVVSMQSCGLAACPPLPVTVMSM